MILVPRIVELRYITIILLIFTSLLLQGNKVGIAVYNDTDNPMYIRTVYVPPKEDLILGSLEYTLRAKVRVVIPKSDIYKERKKKMRSGYQHIHVRTASGVTLLKWKSEIFLARDVQEVTLRLADDKLCAFGRGETGLEEEIMTQH